MKTSYVFFRLIIVCFIVLTISCGKETESVRVTDNDTVITDNPLDVFPDVFYSDTVWPYQSDNFTVCMKSLDSSSNLFSQETGWIQCYSRFEPGFGMSGGDCFYQNGYYKYHYSDYDTCRTCTIDGTDTVVFNPNIRIEKYVNHNGDTLVYDAEDAEFNTVFYVILRDAGKIVLQRDGYMWTTDICDWNMNFVTLRKTVINP